MRLRQGDPNAETVYGHDPARMARHWVGLGAEWLHVVNLDGAFTGTASGAQYNSRLFRAEAHYNLHPHVQRLSADAQLARQELPINLQRLQQIRKAVDVPIQFGGGLRTLHDIELALALGADRVVLGTVAVRDPELVRAAIQRWGGRQVVVGLDAKDGKVATHGWQKVSQLSAIELGHRMAALGVERVLYTDINRDGMLSGVNVHATATLGDMTGLLVIASGGVAGLDDIHALKRHEHYGIDGVIVGQALYTNALALPAAIEIGKAPRKRRSAGIIPIRYRNDDAVASDGPLPGSRASHPHHNGGPQLLLLYNHFFEEWQFPRGGVEAGEIDLNCARREFAIKTELPILKIYEDCPTVLDFTVSIRGYDIEQTVVYFLAEIGAGTVRLGHDNHSEYRWCSLEEAKNLLRETSLEQIPAWQAAIRFSDGRISN